MSRRKKVLYLGREGSYTAKFLKENNLGFIIPINNINLGVQKFIKLIEELNKKKIRTNLKSDLL